MEENMQICVESVQAEALQVIFKLTDSLNVIQQSVNENDPEYTRSAIKEVKLLQDEAILALSGLVEHSNHFLESLLKNQTTQ